MGEGLANQSSNPEVRVNTEDVGVVIERTTMRLRQTIIRLHNAVNGHPMWLLHNDDGRSPSLLIHVHYLHTAGCLTDCTYRQWRSQREVWGFNPLPSH